jgi:nicotinate-nucleotide adenylyltransferase
MGGVSIGLFGGTFDPIHDGHLALIDSFLRSGIVQEIWVIPTYESPHRQSESQTPFRNRVEMARLALKDKQGVTVSDIEAKLPTPSFSVQTVGEFKSLFPFYQLYWCLGTDQLVKFHEWVLFDAILFMSRLLVAERPGFDTTGIQGAILDVTEFVEHEPLSISSTEIRSQIRNGKIQEARLPKQVKDYIEAKALYR